jgi:hypothetical protein
VATTAAGVVEIGARLLDIKARLGHGHFGEWLDAEFAMSQDSAENFMKAARFAGDIPNWSEIAPAFDSNALYLRLGCSLQLCKNNLILSYILLTRNRYSHHIPVLRKQTCDSNKIF